MMGATGCLEGHGSPLGGLALRVFQTVEGTIEGKDPPSGTRT
jgi:hypothetical protein